MTQTELIKKAINLLLDSGHTKKEEIYNEIRNQYPNIPRPTIRRACRDLRIELQKKAEILRSNLPGYNSPRSMR